MGCPLAVCRKDSFSAGASIPEHAVWVDEASVLLRSEAGFAEAFHAVVFESLVQSRRRDLD